MFKLTLLASAALYGAFLSFFLVSVVPGTISIDVLLLLTSLFAPSTVADQSIVPSF